MAFGLDSVIELASAGVLIWRLNVELRHGQGFSERAERTASRIGAVLLFTLAAYIVGGAAWSLWTRHGEAFSLPGLIVALLAMPIMTLLARRKIAIATQLGSRAMRADAAESITCGHNRNPAQNREKIAKTSSGEVSLLNRSRFHTVCKKSATKLEA